MAQVPVRVNLAAMAFPFLSELSGRGIIVKQADQNYVAQITSKEDLDKDVGIPVLYYCHNIIATSQGYQSISYLPLISAVAGVNDFADVIQVIDGTTGQKAYLAYTISGNWYYSYDPYYNWVSCGALAAGKTVTLAYVNGTTYFYLANTGCYKFDFSTNSIAAVTLGGLTAANILGIVAVQGYMIAWSVNAIAWSSLLDPTDFVPSLVTGAGSGSVQGARGIIVTCVSHTTGFVVYTNQNAVAVPASGNSRYPFNFRELVNSGGLASADLVTWDANSGNHYTYTTSGLQLISLTQTQTTFPEVTDFLAGSVFEDYDELTDTFTTQELTATLKKRLTLCSDRYLIISYGISSFTHAIVYDLALKRWSKFKVPHVQCFEFSLLTAETVETPRRSIAFLQADGSVKVVKIDSRDTSAYGVILLGKYQYIRQRLTQLHTADIENITPGGYFDCTDKYSLDGKNFAGTKVGYPLVSSNQYQKLAFDTVGINHSLMMRGAFNIVSLVINVSVHGRV